MKLGMSKWKSIFIFLLCQWLFCRNKALWINFHLWAFVIFSQSIYDASSGCFYGLISGDVWIHIATLSQYLSCRSFAWIIHADANIMVIGPTILVCGPILLASPPSKHTHTPKHQHYSSVDAENWCIFDFASSSLSVSVPVCVCDPNGKEISFYNHSSCIFCI